MQMHIQFLIVFRTIFGTNIDSKTMPKRSWKAVEERSATALGATGVQRARAWIHLVWFGSGLDWLVALRGS